MTTGSCPPDETSLGVGQVQSYLQITTAWLGLTIPTPSGKQCQGRGSVDDRDILYLYYKGSLGSIKTGN